MSLAERKSSFPPHITPHARLLILGSLPGEASLAARQYYAHPRNLFWRLMGEVLGEDLPALPYQERLTALARRHVGLWDAVASASRKGSLDAAIRAVEANPLADLAARLPHLNAVACNGQASHRIATRPLATSGLPVIALPSSSPAHAAMPFAEKRSRWLELRRFL
ncbi:DNA-deoxyinosine glycosylase [Alteraurantiacibacter buctensis]|uniref:DNA-deoxyinosine glycosylase n=1 Tax=Alteraurantiacibacter buctensis TaxID=1503981 RepID=A0A844YX53_9SPHN|nr:DNA-deoxyinosine glycosylase [Alteraurantiacibacter buctensis]